MNSSDFAKLIAVDLLLVVEINVLKVTNRFVE